MADRSLESRVPSPEPRPEAPALHIAVTADRFACFGCALWGAQDTLYTGGAGYGARSYFYGAAINGSVDTIFGGSSSVFDSAALTMATTVTAPRGEPASAFLFTGCTLGGAGILLGRPWGQLSAVVFKDTAMSNAVEAPGWDDWQHGCTNGKSPWWCAPLTFAEYNSTGPGGAAAGRVKWSKQLTAGEAAAWNESGVLRGWQPARTALRHGDAARAVLSRFPAAALAAAWGADAFAAVRAAADS